MIDLHTHSFLSDGVLIPSELVRRAEIAGCTAIAITDHVDPSNIDAIIASTVKVAEVLNKYWNIYVIPGVEITYAPVEVFEELTVYARQKGARIVVGHGESPVEPVIPGTNEAAIRAGVDILAHPGHITPEVASLAAQKGVYLEITCRAGHNITNKHVFDTARAARAGLVLNTDSHIPENILTEEMFRHVLGELTDSDEIVAEIGRNSENIVKKTRG